MPEQNLKQHEQYKATIIISATAKRKINLIKKRFKQRTVLFGTCGKSKNYDNLYFIDDVILIPQEFKNNTIYVDQQSLTEYMNGISDKRKSNIKALIELNCTEPDCSDNDNVDAIKSYLPLIDSLWLPKDDQYYIYYGDYAKATDNIRPTIYDNITKTYCADEEINLIHNDGDMFENFMKQANRLIKKGN